MEKQIFSYNQDVSKTAYLNWNMDKENIPDDFSFMADCYEKATQTMLDAVLNDNTDKKADSLIFPIMFCFDHSIELYLKAIILMIYKNRNELNTFENTHDVKKLFSKAKELLYDKKDLEDHFSVLEEYIDELEANGNPFKMDFSRYPIDAKGNVHFYLKDHVNKVIDLEVLKEKYTAIVDALKGTCFMLESEESN